MIRFVSWTAPLLIVAAPAFAQPASTETAAAPAKPQKVCRKYAVTGQRIAKSICYTADQWAELDRRGEQNAKDIINAVGDHAATANLKGGGTGGLSTGPLFGLGQ